MTRMDGPAIAQKAAGRRVMVVADPTRESGAALQYALAHAILDKDELILMHVMSPCPRKGAFSLYSLSSLFRKQHLNSSNATVETPIEGGGGGSNGGSIFNNIGGGIFGSGGIMDGNGGGKDGDFLKVMKKACEKARPKMTVTIEKVDQGFMDKASTVLSQTKLFDIDLLIIGQQKNMANAILGARRNGGPLLGGSKVIDTAEFLIENSLCTCWSSEEEPKCRLPAQYQNPQEFLAAGISEKEFSNHF